MEAVLAAVAGFSFGFGVAAVFFAKVMVSRLTSLVDASKLAAVLLRDYQDTGVVKVEEQNMTQVAKRLDRLEDAGVIRKEDESGG
jgi:hypothetical protein